MELLYRWLAGIFCLAWMTVPSFTLARSASDLLAIYGASLAIAGAGVALLWAATLGLRQLWNPPREPRRPTESDPAARPRA